MLKSKLRKPLFFLVYSLIIFGVGYLIAALISNRFGYELYNVMFVEGIIVIAIGALSSISGNPSGISLQGFGRTNAQYSSFANLEATRMERESTNHFKNFLKNSVAEFTSSKLAIIAAGVLILLFSYFDATL